MVNPGRSLWKISARALTLALSFSLTAGTGTALAQKGGGGGGGGNQTVAVLLSGVPVLSAAVGSTTIHNVILSNSGSASLTIATLAVTGASAGDFRLGGTCATGIILPRTPPANTCVIQIAFAPTALGRRLGVLNATFANAPAISVALTGDGLAPGPVFVIDTTSNSIDFGSRAVGSQVPFLSDTGITLENPGGQTLTGSMTFIGANPGDFAFGSAGTRTFNCPANIALGPPPSLTSCQLGLDFIPTAVGPRTATLRFTSNDPANPVVDIALSGLGTSPVVQPPPPPITSAADFSDSWGNPNEPAWALSITHHKVTTDALVASWQTFDVNGQPVWFVLQDGHWADALTYTGTLHQRVGPAFSAPYDPSLAGDVIVGTATLSFTDAANGTYSFTVNGISGSKTITRIPF